MLSLGCPLSPRVTYAEVFLSARNLRESFAFQLVFGLSCAELGNSLWPWFFMPTAGTAACTCQAVALQFFSFASILWSAAIAWTLNAATQMGSAGGGGGGGGLGMMRGSVVSGGGGGGGGDIRRFHAIIWSISAVLVVLPWAGGVLGPAGAWCWIDGRKGRKAQVFRLVCFYLPLWGIIAFEVVVYYRVIKRLMAVTRLAAATKAVREDMWREAEARRGRGTS